MSIELDEPAVEWLQIPLTEATRRRLEALANACHADRTKVAASLLHDVLADDEDAHFPETIGSA